MVMVMILFLFSVLVKLAESYGNTIGSINEDHMLVI